MYMIALILLLVRLCSKCFKLGFNSMCTENFQMYKLCLEKAEEPEIKFPTWIGSYRKQVNSRKMSSSASLAMLKPLTMWITTSLKILKEIGLPNHFTCLLRNLYAGQEATVRTRNGKTDWLKVGKGVQQGFILSSCMFNLHAEYIMWNARLVNHKLETRLLREISTTSDMQMIPL